MPRLLIAALAITALGRAALGHGAADGTAPRKTADPVLTVCADPNNMPFSNRAGEGFENRIAQLVAHDLNLKIRYVWWAQRRGFVRNTLKDARCDLWPGIAAGVENVLTTRPYYRSTYVFVSRRSEALSGLTLDDARLRSLSIGVQMVGNDAMNTPPAHAIARRGVVRNIRGFMLYGDYGKPNPPARIVEAVARGEVDVAMVWGPLAGYFASRSAVPLRLEPVTPALDAGVWPMTYDISMGVRRNEPQLRERIEHILTSRKPQIDAILHTYRVPELPIAATTAQSQR
jgi:mxaJ protein